MQDAKDTILLASVKASLTKRVMYVSYSYTSEKGWHWAIFENQPRVTISHWKVTPNSELTAHIAEKGKDQYFYEECNETAPNNTLMSEQL